MHELRANATLLVLTYIQPMSTRTAVMAAMDTRQKGSQ